MASSVDSPRIPLLVVCDGGAAGRDLLVRRDLEIAWALTHDEAEAYLSKHRPALVLVREAMAAETLARGKEHAAGVPVMVLLEPDGWANRKGYLDLGAAVLAQSSARARILEAVAEITGRSFPEHVRVPFAGFVNVTCPDGQTRLAETVDMSTTGMCLRDMDDARVGMAVEVLLDSLDPPLRLPAMTIRADGDTVGLRFLPLEPEVEHRLERLVEVQSARFPPPEMPEGLTVDLGGTLTMELIESATSDLGADIAYRDMLRDAVVNGREAGDRWPRWLDNIEHKLTDYERRAIDLAPDESHGSAAIDLRILLARARVEEPYTFPSRALAQKVLDFSRLLEDHAGASSADLADIAVLRGHLLRAVYGDLSRRPGDSARAA